MDEVEEPALAPTCNEQLQTLLARDLQLDRIRSDLVAGHCTIPAQSLAVLICAAAQSGLADEAQQLEQSQPCSTSDPRVLSLITKCTTVPAKPQ